jgi:cellobiose epimerase
LIWYLAAIDTVEGGFFSSFTFDWKLAEKQDKMIVSQARHVWTHAKAAEIFY